MCRSPGVALGPEVRVRRLTREFFARDAVHVARALIGAKLVREAGGLRRAGTIVETEAYEGPADRACHARFGRTPARRDLFGPPGHAYVFLVYGMHLCFNVVCATEGAGHAVLVRGVEPDGPDDARGDGPGRVTRALGIGREAGGVDLVTSPALYLVEGAGPARAVAASPRVGVSYAGEHAERPWRFFDPTSPSVSRPPASQLGRGREAR